MQRIDLFARLYLHRYGREDFVSRREEVEEEETFLHEEVNFPRFLNGTKNRDR